MTDARELSRDECRDLLSAGAVARVAVVTPDGPHIVPVNYLLLDDTVVVRTSAYSLLGTYARDAVVALEIDHAEPGTRSGWSVVVRGRCTVESDPRTIRSLRAMAPEGPWAGGTRNLYLRLRTDDLTGRTVGEVTPPATAEVLETLETTTDAWSGA